MSNFFSNVLFGNLIKYFTKRKSNKKIILNLCNLIIWTLVLAYYAYSITRIEKKWM